MGFIIKTRQGSGMRKFNMFGPARTDLNRLYIFTYSLKYVIVTVGQGRQAGRPAGYGIMHMVNREGSVFSK